MVGGNEHILALKLAHNHKYLGGKMRKYYLLSLLIYTTVLSGCASIISDTSYPVRIVSTPEQADFSITNEDGIKVHSGVTPSTVILKSGAGYFDGERYTINYSKEGYNPQTTLLDSGVNGWYFGNFLFGGLTGLLIIDPATGAMFDLPEEASASLTKQNRQTTSNSAPIYSPATLVPQPQTAQQPLQPVVQEETVPIYQQPQVRESKTDLRYCLSLVDNKAIAECVQKAKR